MTDVSIPLTASATATRGRLQAIRGMNDVLPDDAPLWAFFEDTVRDVFRQYGYRNIRTPIVEKTELFVRGVGEVTDIVEKEMYTFDDNGESLSLRPEGTAPTVRAALEHNLLYDGPKRLWYSGPLFRHERPQKGRYRAIRHVRRRGARVRGSGHRHRAARHGAAAVAAAGARRHHARTQYDRLGRRTARIPRAGSSRISGRRPTCSMPTRSAGSTPIRCASWTARIPRCRK